MFINKSWFWFCRDELPEWQCPTCGKASLGLSPEEFHVHYSGETENLSKLDDFDADWVGYRVSAVLRCSNRRCNEVVTMAGAGHVEQEHARDEKGQWELTYRDCFRPSFFEPCLIPISITENIPTDVRTSLDRSFSLIFANRDAAANQLRVALEVLLDEQSVKVRDKNDELLRLGVRIRDHLQGDLLKYKDRLSAIQWIGNDGSHGNDAITVSDLLAGFELIESVLTALYPSTGIDHDELARKIIEKKQPKRTGS